MMSSNPLLDWLPQVLQGGVYFGGLVFLIGALIYAISQRHRCPGPAKCLIWALSLLLVAHAITPMISFVAVRYWTVGQLGVAFAMWNAISFALSTTAYVLMIKAVFMLRPNSIDGPIPSSDFGGRPLADQPSGNPYASPRQ
ncbi:MAG: hypothetical protein WBD20_04030 [Pirellulaceae bacterium]